MNLLDADVAAASRNTQTAALIAALRPFVAAYTKQVDPGTADLYDEQPMSVHVTLGDCRRAERVLRDAEGK